MKKRVLKLFLIAVIGFFTIQITVESVNAIGSMVQMEASIPEPTGCNCSLYHPQMPLLAKCLLQTSWDNGQLMSRKCVDGQYLEENCDCSIACGILNFDDCDTPIEE